MNLFPKHYFQKSSNSIDNNKNAYELTRPVVEYFVNKTYYGIADNKKEMVLILLEKNRAFAQSSLLIIKAGYHNIRSRPSKKCLKEKREGTSSRF